MTLKEAKDILKKEFAVIGLHKSTEPFEFDDSHWFGYEKPSVLEAFRVLAKEGYYVTISVHDYDMRKKRLQKEYEQNTKAPGSGEEQPNESNPALKESASQFNDALLDEQAKKIEELTEDNERQKDQVAVIYAYKENNEKCNLKQIKRLGKEISRLNKVIHKKNMKIEELKNELADKVVVKINAQALKSAESALAYKEKVIAEKDEVIADLGKELKEKHKKYVWFKGAYEAAHQILNSIADYAAKHPDKKFSDQMVGVDKAEEGRGHSGKIVLWGKDFVKKFEENEESVFDFFKRHKETAEELYEVADEAFEQLLLFGEVIIKSEK